MTINIYHQISENERDVYEFYIEQTFDGTLKFGYLSYWRSRRDQDHPWGDQWRDYYKNEEREAVRELEKQFEQEEGFPWDEVSDGYFEWSCKFYDVRNKYNPITNKNQEGYPFLTGASGPGKPKPLLSDEELLRRLKFELTKAMETAIVGL